MKFRKTIEEFAIITVGTVIVAIAMLQPVPPMILQSRNKD